MPLFRSLKQLFRTYFLTGLLVLVPGLLTFFLLKWLVGVLDGMLGDLPERYLGRHIPGLGVVLILIGLKILLA